MFDFEGGFLLPHKITKAYKGGGEALAEGMVAHLVLRMKARR